VSEVFVESVQKAAEALGMTPAFVGFIVVALVGGAAEMASAFRMISLTSLQHFARIASGHTLKLGTTMKIERPVHYGLVTMPVRIPINSNHQGASIRIGSAYARGAEPEHDP